LFGALDLETLQHFGNAPDFYPVAEPRRFVNENVF
jgi:hypothetical protein